MEFKSLDLFLPLNIKREEGYVDPLVEDFCEIIETSSKEGQNTKSGPSKVQEKTYECYDMLQVDGCYPFNLDCEPTQADNCLKTITAKQDNELVSTFELPTILVCGLCDKFECLDRRILSLHANSKHKDILDSLYMSSDDIESTMNRIGSKN